MRNFLMFLSEPRVANISFWNQFLICCSLWKFTIFKTSQMGCGKIIRNLCEGSWTCSTLFRPRGWKQSDLFQWPLFALLLLSSRHPSALCSTASTLIIALVTFSGLMPSVVWRCVYDTSVNRWSSLPGRCKCKVRYVRNLRNTRSVHSPCTRMILVPTRCSITCGQ